MTTTPETIAELKRLLAENPATMRSDGRDVAGAAYSSLPLCRLIASAVNALPSLLTDLEAAQKALAEIRERAESSNKPTYLIEVIASTARHALAATGGK